MKSDNKGSFTVEAALALPIFIFAIIAFLFVFRMVLMQIQLQGALTEAAKELSGSAYLTVEAKEDSENEKKIQEQLQNTGGKLASGAIIRKYFVNEKQYKNMLSKDISYVGSSYLDEEKSIDLIGEYCVEIPIPIIRLCKIPIMQRVKTRAYIGVDRLLSGDGVNSSTSMDEGDYVFITETGIVYHLSLECSSLKLNISECKWVEVEKKRNESGGRYKRCEKCCRGAEQIQIVYICSDGDAYHQILNCSGLKRTIRKVKRSDVEGEMPVCSKCGR